MARRVHSPLPMRITLTVIAALLLSPAALAKSSRASEWITDEVGAVKNCDEVWSLPVKPSALTEAVRLLEVEEAVEIPLEKAERLAGRKLRPARGEFPVLARAVRTGKSIPSSCHSRGVLLFETDDRGPAKPAPMIVLMKRMPDRVLVDAGF